MDHNEVRAVLAGNVRARLAWQRISQQQLMSKLGWSRRTLHNKLAAITDFTPRELVAIAELFDLEDPGPLYRVPEDFPSSPSVSSESALAA